MLGKLIATSSNSTSDEQDKDYNVFRDSLLRYLGYTNEVGESFRYQFPKFVRPSYAVAFGYCVADAASTGHHAWNSFDNDPPTTSSFIASQQSREMATFVATADTLLWQSLASVMIPGGTINVIVKASRFAARRASLPVVAAAWGPTGVGLASIPFIIKPIDNAVDYLLDNTTRHWIVPEEKKT
jgi:fission process protein 1